MELKDLKSDSPPLESPKLSSGDNRKMPSKLILDSGGYFEPDDGPEQPLDPDERPSVAYVATENDVSQNSNKVAPEPDQI